ncbi:uroporphyrinogen decarboxylase family protein [Clostridium sp. KNHs214]|uniref:uroporphyrinogen decarboxylase family protein n=1 Tax=Clostridium sp. KNHs214 TaxID=1540257 RepID=UPI0009DFF9F6|nr:uroporphyrinogen decarboxylase family protein [Clostridium sp. KNHs214]
MERYIKPDQMTPKERTDAFARGQEIDRIPCMPQMGVTMANLMGITTYEYYHSAERMAELEIFLFEKIRPDSVGVGTTLRGVAEAMGSKIGYPPNGISYLEEPVLKDIRDAHNLLPADPYKDGKLPLCLKALKIVIDKIGHLVDVGSDIAGPFSAAAAVVGTENLLKGMIKYPDKVHTLLEVVTETNLRIVEAFAQYGVGLCMSDPVASTSLISVKQFKEFAMPYQKKCVDKMKELTGKGTTIHICGRSREIWEPILETGITTFSLDNAEDMEEAKNVMGDRVCIVGNLKPVDTMRNGTIEDVMMEAKECIRKSYDSKMGYILSTGCQIPMGTPIENIQALMDAARIYGRCPIDKEILK